MTMSDVMDYGSTTIDIDPDLQVRKLQELVKKLERQNQLLRNKQNDTLTQAPQSSNHCDNLHQAMSVTHAVNGNTASTVSDPIDDHDVNLKSNITATSGDLTVQKTSMHRRDLGDFENYSLDDLELLEIDDSSSVEEDSWLYTSPQKSSAPSSLEVSPYQWVRQEFEQPSPDVQNVKRLLVNKLDEVSRGVSRSSSHNALSSLLSPSQSHDNVPSLSLGSARQSSPLNSARQTSPVNTHKSDVAVAPSIRPSLMNAIGSGNGINTGTFTRPKKKSLQHHPTVSCPDPVTSSNDLDSVDASESRPGMEKSYSTDTLSDDEAGVHRLTHVGDVQVVARMQEESLRQSLSSPKSSSRRAFSQSLNRPNGGLFSLAHQSFDNDGGLSFSARSSPGRFESELSQAARQSNSSLTSCSSQCSSQSTNSPPDSPYGSQYLNTKPAVSDTHRRSMPNLNRSGLSTLTPNYSDSRLSAKASPPTQRKPSPRRGTLGYSGVRQGSPARSPARNPGTPPKNPSQGSPGRGITQGSPSRNTPQSSPGRGARSGLPAPKTVSTSIPRPGSASKLPGLRKSSIPGVRKPSSVPSQVDDSWKDGCF